MSGYDSLGQVISGYFRLVSVGHDKSSHVTSGLVML
jgi:hypothetical protein